jgi:biopolymer transport protein ExbD
MLKQFMEPGAENQQYYPGMKQNTTFVSRKQCVIAAIESQIQELAKQHPNRNVGLVTFNDEVIIIGDGTKEPVFIAGDKLHKYDEIMAISSGSADKIQ